VSHASARLNLFGRGLLISRVLEEGWTAAATAEAAGVSRATVYKWLARFRGEGAAGLLDRRSCPEHCPRRLSGSAEQRILQLRRQRKLGPHRLGAILGIPRSTCYAVLRRHGLQRLDWMDRPSGEVIRRYERERPGELIHVDVKKLGRIRPGGGWRVLGRQAGLGHGIGVGYDYVHSAVDDHSRLAYSEIHSNERVDTCAAFLVRAHRFYADHGVTVERIMTDNAMAYRVGHAFREAAHLLGVRQVFTRSHRPQTNGKVERFNRTLLEEWAYVRPYQSNEQRVDLLPGWLHTYNHHRSHTALGGLPPIARVNNLSGNYS
jgi:transposase InsO family protein